MITFLSVSLVGTNKSVFCQPKTRAFALGKAADESSFSSVQRTSALVYSACANNEVSSSVRKEYDHVSSPFGLKKKTTCPRSLTSDV